MRARCLVAGLLMMCFSSAGPADATVPFHAGVARLSVAADVPFDAVVWYPTLELAGAVPNGAHLISYCDANPNDIMSCDHTPDGNNDASTLGPGPMGGALRPEPLPLKAVVLLDPFAVLFQRPDLAAVTMPVLIFRPNQSELPGAANAVGLAAALPHASLLRAVPGGHFVFADVCSTALRATTPYVCQDPPGTDRAAARAAIQAEIIAFLTKTL